MKLAIIICTYNSGERLAKTLDSILSQTADDFEVVLVDGASTDGTVEIIKNYESKFAGKLHWASEPDDGIYEAMNKGIDLAKGDWLYFMGADDVLFDSSVLEKISNHLDGNADFLYGNVQWGQDGVIYDGEFSPLKIMQKNICHQAIFCKKQVFKKLGKFETKYRVWADWVFNLKLFGDATLHRQYIDVVIAKYSTCGFSSERNDANFIEDIDYLIEKYLPEEYLENRKKIRKLESEVEKKDRKIQQKDEELKLMQSSKFWKIRNAYVNFKKK